jgi:CubicO group peptidase (beta-lactamase class C family)
VVADGELAMSGSVGGVDEHTVYRIASMTKSFSCAATLALRDDGVLRLDDPIGELAPELHSLRSPTDDAAPVTIRDLMSMSSGLVTDDPWADRNLALTVEAFDRIVADGAVFAHPTGTAHEYSNLGYGVLGQVVHRATGIRIQEHISSRLLDPLGMTSSSWTQPTDRPWMRPMRTIDGEYVEEIETPDDGVVSPMGGIWSTVSDLARWVTWLDDAFPARDGTDDTTLRRSSRREMQTFQRLVGPRQQGRHHYTMGYGYGVRVLHRTDGVVVATHSGGFPGYGSNMRWVPGRRLGVITLANTTYAPMTELGAELMDLLEDNGTDLHVTAPLGDGLRRAAESLASLLAEWHDDLAITLFANNVEPDDSWERRRTAAAPLNGMTVESIVATNLARGRIVGRRSDGEPVTITFALAPDDPTRIQVYEITGT